MLAYDLRSYSMKAVSTRWRLHAGSMLLSTDARFMVMVEPGCVVVWRLKDDDVGAYSQYTDNQHVPDDLHYDDRQFSYTGDDDNDVSDHSVRKSSDSTPVRSR